RRATFGNDPVRRTISTALVLDDPAAEHSAGAGRAVAQLVDIPVRKVLVQEQGVEAGVVNRIRFKRRSWQYELLVALELDAETTGAGTELQGGRPHHLGRVDGRLGGNIPARA